ncbi:MmcQ/YjbR family DNA-binding protein [Sphingomonas sp. CFBP8993]|uniref:MmcQ/YjbR family DNA-binding protein n=1 Tax=Sphingomonas sp. CFBP8993 TaxID=3096526 RepID=UPI002A6A4745|nr:MmcQ/YjbR family DNA-binding protein [Sphingomonas sp. CFBP8993]MDY0957436.1 MmcQ/YjbR family DNA-binding protein [Sphingomonas sp. CFBP8993]
MTDFLTRIRDIAMLLPGVAEDQHDGETRFLVEGEPFVRVTEGASSVHLCIADEGTEPHWRDFTLTAESDWPLVEDRIARSWELTAPTELLEAGGR